VISKCKYEFSECEILGCQDCGRDIVRLLGDVDAKELGIDPDNCPYCGSENLFVYDDTIPELMDIPPDLQVKTSVVGGIR